MSKYIQLPLTGDTNDHADTQSLLVGTVELYRAMSKFYEDNKPYNPRQLHYYVAMESLDLHLDAMIFKDISNDITKNTRS